MLSEKKNCWVLSKKRLLPTRPSEGTEFYQRYREKSRGKGKIKVTDKDVSICINIITEVLPSLYIFMI